LLELGVAVVLACGGLRQGLVGGGEVSGELRALAAIGAPGGEDGDRQCCSDQDSCGANIHLYGHGKNSQGELFAFLSAARSGWPV
jgi:hypothetical protein